jgi:hypothetical protein
VWAIAVAAVYQRVLLGVCRTLHHDPDSFEFGLHTFCEPLLQLDLASLALNLDLLLLDETSLFFKLHKELVLINHLPSSWKL